MPCIYAILYVMKTKLTLRVEESVIQKAKQLAKTQGTSVSRIFGDFIMKQSEELPVEDLPPITASMVGVIKREGVEIQEASYRKHLDENYL